MNLRGILQAEKGWKTKREMAGANLMEAEQAKMDFVFVVDDDDEQ